MFDLCQGNLSNWIVCFTELYSGVCEIPIYVPSCNTSHSAASVTNRFVYPAPAVGISPAVVWDCCDSAAEPVQLHQLCSMTSLAVQSIPWSCSLLGEQHHLAVSAVTKGFQVLESGRYFTSSPFRFCCSIRRSLSPTHLFTDRHAHETCTVCCLLVWGS